MGSMFIVATGLRKTSFVSVLCDSIMRITRGSFRKAYFGYLFIAVLLAQLIPSPMVVFALVAPLLAELCDKMGVSVSKVMFPLVSPLWLPPVSLPLPVQSATRRCIMVIWKPMA